MIGFQSPRGLARSSKLRRTRRSPRFESLERRDAPAVDLLAASISVAPSLTQPGDTIGITWSISNTGFSTIFNSFHVGFYLSPNSFLDSSDTFLGQFELPPGFPGFYTLAPFTSFFALPLSGSGVWQGDGTYYVGMVSDLYDQVFEISEWNNANTGLMFDIAPFQVFGTQPQKPDLVISSASATPTTLAPGDSLSVITYVANSSATSAGESRLDVYLSHDAIFDGNDRLLASKSVPAVAPFGSLPVQVGATLPNPSDPFWNGATRAYLVFKADGGDWVSESNEFNNGSSGTGADFVSIEIVPTISLTSLPSSPFAPGTIQNYTFKTQAEGYSTLIQQLKKLEPRAKNVVALKPLIDAARQVQTDLQDLSRLIDPVRKGSVSRITLGPNASFDRTSLQLLDRLYLAVAKGQVNVRAAGTSSFVSAMADDDLLKQVQTSVRKDILEGAGVGAFEKTAQIFSRGGRIASEVGAAQGAVLMAKGSAFATAVKRMLQFGLANVEDLDKSDTQRTRDQAKSSLVQQYIEEARKLAEQSLGEASPLAAKLRKLLADLKTLLNRGASTLDKLLSGWDLLNAIPPGKDKPAAGPFTGKWKGELSYPQSLSNGSRLDIGGPMSIQFKSAVRGVYKGAVQMTFTIYDEYFRPVSKSISKGTFVAELDKNLNALFGTLTVQNPRGQVTKTSFNLHETTDGKLTGTLPVNLDSQFVLKRPQ